MATSTNPNTTSAQEPNTATSITTTAMDANFKTIPLFGGAIVASIPKTFQDVSEIRQVPDNQEVFLDADGFSSIVFDILERVRGPGQDNDVEALKWHISDIVAEDIKDCTLCEVEMVTGRLNEKLKAEGAGGEEGKVSAVSGICVAPPGEKMRGRANEPDFVGILVLLVRLEKVGTDFVVAVNVPHMPGGYVEGSVKAKEGKLGALMEMGKIVRERVLGSLEVRDWGLFGEE